MAANPYLTITPILPKGKGIECYMTDESTFQEVTGGSGSGGWQVVDRPRLRAALQWYDGALWQLTLPIMLSSIPADGSEPSSIESNCKRLISWKMPPVGRVQPAVLRVSGPIEGTEFQWVLYSLTTAGTPIRDPHTGHRWRQDYTLVLYQYQPTSSANTVNPQSPSSPAQRAQQAALATNGTSTRQTYAVRAGDSLTSIAARVLGDASQWTQIASLNGIRDPTNLSVGQVLVLP